MAPDPLVPLFVRLPAAQAAALDALVATTGRRKQAVVSELLAGSLSADDAPSEDVLTLDDAADLLRVGPGAVRAAARAGELPGRELGGEWRFAREAVLAWLGGGEGDGRA